MFDPTAQEASEGRRLRVRGTVQGVGFRPWVYQQAVARGLTGRVYNETEGVTVEVWGGATALAGFAEALAHGPPAARVRQLSGERLDGAAPPNFTIDLSGSVGAKVASIPPDLPTCEACLAEVSAPADRRHGYVFTSCTHCGPRFTIALDVPYDRAATTMARFPLCPACAAEYGEVTDRRFHAQPNACPICGPQLSLLDATGRQVAAADVVLAAAARILGGEIVAVKGLGGFHLACDATREDVVSRLRARKRREEKPFAVMLPDLAACERVAFVGAAEGALLTAPERPIVLARPRPGAMLAPAVSPGAPRIGLMLPYTPLHHLLLAAVSRPLVMTSANVSARPIVKDEDEAVVALAGIADAFVVHDRPIATRCDDSVAQVIAGAPLVMRRSRGWVPHGFTVDPAFDLPVLACGAQLDNTFCIGSGDGAYLGPHVGDLENLETLASYTEAIARMERFLGVQPEILAHDLHPDFLSTRYALGRPATLRVPVQHHHAHAVAAMTERGLPGPVLAVAYDGVGLGTDGVAWGAELLWVARDRFERLGTFRPVRLPGGDRAVREPWRLALALLLDAFGEEGLARGGALFERVPAAHRRVVAQLLARGMQSPPSHGMGRLFDGIAALVLGRPEARHKAQLAMAFEAAADEDGASYPFSLELGALAEVDTRPLVRGVVADLEAGASAGSISARFHRTIAEATLALLEHGRAHAGALPVVLTGGCLQNARLTELVLDGAAGAPIYTHRDVPPGDGGLALGQAVVAAAVARTALGG